MATPADLWGEIVPSAVRTPAAILREQGSLLGQKTNHMIQGTVETRTSHSWFHHSFNLVVPALDNYAYELFEISNQANPYPVTVGDETELPDEKAFLRWLGEKLSSKKTKSIIGNLLAQASS